MGVFASKKDKLMSLEKAVGLIRDGDIIALGGKLSAREPMGIVREILRQGKRNLHSIGGAHGMDIDLMCAGGVLGKVQHSYIGFESDFGLAPNYRRACESGSVQVKETDCAAMTMQLRAAQFGLPFIPTPLVAGTDILKYNDDVKQMACPYTGQKVNLLPAMRPNVVILHAHKADEEGNIKILPPFFADALLAETAEKVIVSVEEIIPRDEMKKIGSTIPYYLVAAIVELPLGAHPTSCYPMYTYDRAHMDLYVKLAQRGGDAFRSRYLDKFVYRSKSHADYLEAVGGEAKRRELSRWNENNECWMELLEKEAVAE
jgi:glutaconate CoA-transferase subunit A